MSERLGAWMVKAGLLSMLIVAVGALTPGEAKAGDLRWRLQVSYVSGLQDLADQYKDNIEIAESGPFTTVQVDTVVVPVGLSLSPYYQWDNGLMLGAGVGPFMYLFASAPDRDFTHWQLPLNATIGYSFFHDGPVSPYVRAGPSYHVAGGNFYDSSSLGFIAAAGVELLKTDHVALGLEAAYDSAEVKIDSLRSGGTRGIKAAEFTLGAFILFH